MIGPVVFALGRPGETATRFSDPERKYLESFREGSLQPRMEKLSFRFMEADGRDGLLRISKLLAIDHPAASMCYPN